MQEADMHQANRPGRPGAFDDVVALFVDDLVIDRAGEHPIVPMGIERAPVAAGDHFEGSVFQCHLVDEQKTRDHVVIGHRLERKVLVPFYLSRRARQLGIHFPVVKANGRTDQLDTVIHCTRTTHDIGIDVRDFLGRLHAAKGGFFRTVPWL